MRSGSLTVVGTGIRLSQMSMEARISIESAEKVLYSVADAVTETAIKKLNPTAESLQPFYGPDKHCLVTYQEMVERILHFVRKKLRVCAVFYGHPGVFVYSSHESIQLARKEGFKATMLPATSAEDCLFADLGVDPATSGCQSFEATDFLIRRRKFDPCSHLILWQIGNIGNWKPEKQDCSSNLRALVEVLQEHYDAKHETVLYQAAQYASSDPSIARVPLSKIPQASISAVTTLYVPPKDYAAFDYAMVDRLGIPRTLLRKPERQSGRQSRAGKPVAPPGRRRRQR
ncbi:MAG: hypothetical protein HY040_09810 [Planctomycetes bacterium]|nr:hypothetical protein [Planctomycetota bacterium]